jgi:Flp pilus assembly protein TadD
VVALGLGGCAALEVDRAREYNEDGVLLYEGGEYGHALESFRMALALRPKDPGLVYNIGQCYDRMGDVARAEQTYAECLKLDPNHAACRHALVVLQVRQGRRDEATRAVQEWLAREPKLPAPYVEDAWLCEQLGDLPRAERCLQQALEQSPSDAHALTELAVLNEKLQRPDRALVLYERSLEEEPHQPDVAERLRRLRSQGVQPPRPD